MMAARRATGIDISRRQKTFKPSQAVMNDLDFVILKASQANFADDKFEEFYPVALAAPVRGAYHYFITSKVTTTEKTLVKSEKKNKPPKEVSQTVEIAGFNWREQADIFLKQVKGKDLHFVALDLEIIGGTDPRVARRRITNQYNRVDVQNIRRWVNEVNKQTGLPVLLYTRANVFNDFIVANGGADLKKSEFWIAWYPDDREKAEDGSPYEGGKIPGVTGWRFWQYSVKENGEGPRYGAKSASIDLDVYNGTAAELHAWLGLKGLARSGRRGDGGGQRSAVDSLTQVSAQLVAMREAGLNPSVRLDLNLDGGDPGVRRDFQRLLAMLKESGITPQVQVNFQAGSPQEARLPTGKGSPKEETTTGAGEKKPPEEPPKTAPGFMVVVKPKRGKKTAVQSFKEKDDSGKPIIAPLDTLKLGERITREEGERLRVSAKHKVSKFDKGDGKVLGADGRTFYLITDDAVNGDAAGLYVLEPDVQRV